LDNDLLLGNVRHFITEDLLSQYDYISGVHSTGKHVKNWGPFTLYRNSKVTNSLFLLAADPLIDLYDTKGPLFIDEWGGGRIFPNDSRRWNSSMSGILTNHAEQLGIRVFRKGFPIVWDGACGRQEQRCAECTLDLSTQAPQRLTTRIAKENCTLEQECRQEEVLLCHYQKSKKTLEASLRTDANRSVSLLKEGRLRANYLEGFVSRSRVDVANATTTRS
jgi:hypothetical protein